MQNEADGLAEAGSLRQAVDRYLAGVAGSQRDGAAAMSARYRAGGSSAGLDFAAYLTARLPATSAAVLRVLSEVRLRRPDFSPCSLLDVGAGPGTASWMANAIWDSLDSVTMLDADEAFLRLAQQLASSGPRPLARAAFRRGSVTEPLPEADLVIAAYVLAEVPEAGIERAMAQLLAAARGMLVIVEPGTPAGFARLRRARRMAMGHGAVTAAPCPHDGPCPMVEPDWCHFAVRLARSRAHMHAKRASVPYEDEKFAYVALAREGVPSGGARVLAPPGSGKAGLTLKLCSGGGLETRMVPRRDRTAFAALRKAAWGDLI